MFKRVSSLCAILFGFFLLCSVGYADSQDDWKSAPTIVSVYELEKGKIFIEWEGSAQLYQVKLDNEVAATSNLNNTTIDIKSGSHRISVIPVRYESTNTDTNVEFSIGIFSANLDLSVFGIDPQNLETGTPSDAIIVDYSVDPLFSAKPEIIGGETDFDNRIRLSFTDKYFCDIYRIVIKSGKDSIAIEFDTNDEDAIPFIKKSNSTVTITLDPDFLRSKGCFVPELDESYTFSVQLRKTITCLYGEMRTPIRHDSGVSKTFTYTPLAAWKAAPTVTYASQTADGQITIEWDHEDNGLGCQYEIIQKSKILGIKKSSEVVGTTASHEFSLNDLINGEYYFTVTPILAGEHGTSSSEVSIKLENEWIAAPILSCEQMVDGQIKLSWTTAEAVDSYHITVYTGDSTSLLRFVNLDYNKYTEFDVVPSGENMEYLFEYNKSEEDASNIRLKFEIYGIHYAANGEKQNSTTSNATLQLN